MNRAERAEFAEIILAHTKRYPLMQPRDYGKLVYQSEFGPEHMITDAQRATAMILSEWQTAESGAMPCHPEPIGNGLCRFHMTAERFSPDSAAELARLFIQSAREHTGTRNGLEARLKVLAQLPISGLEAWLAGWRDAGCPPVRHSDIFRTAYRPHYRILRRDLADSFLSLCC